MAVRDSLIGRDDEVRRLREALRQATAGQGSLVLVAGEAGIGKTSLMEHVAGGAGVPVLRGSARPGASSPYGPIVAALRSHLRSSPDGLGDCGPLSDHLRILLPELGPPPAASDMTTLQEAVRCAFAAVAADGGAVMLLDDLQWSDAATLELLADLAPAVADLRMLVLAGYRTDELPREHPLRRMRNQLRRDRQLSEVSLETFGEGETAALVEAVLGASPSRPLVRTIQDRSQGLPFFVEELATTLTDEGRLRRGAGGMELVEGADVTVPDTVRDAVLLSCSDLSPQGRAAAEVAAVAGPRFALDPVVELAGEPGVGELLEHGLVGESGDGWAAFRHALVRESLYRDIPWLRRRSLHRELGERLEASGAAGAEVATHWLGAHDEERARIQLLSAAADFESAHAYRDAAAMARRALDLWPEESEIEQRLATLELHAGWSELAGELGEASRAWREAAAILAGGSDGRALASAHRRLGRVSALQGDRAGAIDSLTTAADAFAAAGDPAEAAADRLGAADFLQFAGRHGASLELSRRAATEARAAERLDLLSRALAAEGVVTAKRGDFEDGSRLVKEGLSLALEHGLTTEAADAYQRLGTVFETAGDYASAQGALESALDLCRISGDTGPEAGCVACMAYVLRELGEWPRSLEICRELIGTHEGNGVRVIADGVSGYVRGIRGELGPARRLLTAGFEGARRLDVFSMQVDCAAALALVADYDGDLDEALDRCRFLLARWERSEDHHYAIWGLRLAASLFAQHGALEDAHACAQGLTRIATDSGHADALAALAHALGEIALAEGDADLAVEQLGRAVELHRSLRIPAERAQILHRAGVALAAAGESELAVERHAEAYRLARNLGCRPLAGRCAAAIEDLGESVEQRLGREAANGGTGTLSRRELEVVRLVAEGRTNREIAAELVLSTRTIDMHVRNILAKLDCRSRVEASIKAGEAGLLRS